MVSGDLAADELRRRFPSVAWDTPLFEKVPVRLVERFRCRYCIAQKDIAAADIGREGFVSEAAFREHLRLAHGRR